MDYFLFPVFIFWLSVPVTVGCSSLSPGAMIALNANITKNKSAAPKGFERGGGIKQMNLFIEKSNYLDQKNK